MGPLSMVSSGDQETGRLPVLRAARRWEEVLDPARRRGLVRVLLPHLRAQRWFGDKAGAVVGVAVRATLRLAHPGGPTHLVVVDVDLARGGHSSYQLLLTCVSARRATTLAPGARVALVRVDEPRREVVLCDGIAVPSSCARLLRAVGAGQPVTGRGVTLRGHASAPLRAGLSRGDDALAKAGGAEQSNTSVVFGGRWSLKLFRRLEAGPNPDVEVTRHLAEGTAFRNAVPWAGSLELEEEGRPTSTVALVTGWVESRGDAWRWALRSVSGFLERASSVGSKIDRAPVPDASARCLLDDGPSTLAARLVGEDGRWAARLGQRTAALHRALASGHGDTGFGPEPLTPDEQRATARAIRGRVAHACTLLRRALDRLPAALQGDAREVLRRGGLVGRRLRVLAGDPVQEAQTRVHGDLHLGQVLWTGQDFVFLDFEGEPARPLAERRRAGLPLRDVAGMVRSLHYAACVGTQGLGPRAATRARHWWHALASHDVRAYQAEARGAGWIPRRPSDVASLLDVLVLHKAAYELVYELNHRPTWVGVPLSGLLLVLRTPVGQGRPRTTARHRRRGGAAPTRTRAAA